MREILFRGKTTLDNEWGVGAGVYKSEGYTWIITDDATKTENRGTGSDAINPATIGQYTGLTDKNGTKIFEGDVVRLYLVDDIEMGIIKFNDIMCRFMFFSKDGGYSFDNACTFEVIGNIHDNPELMKGEQQ